MNVPGGFMQGSSQYEKQRKEKRLKVKLKVSFFFCFFSFFCTVAFAHQPYWNKGSPTPGQAFVVENVTVSKALFGNLEVGEVDYFKLEVTDNFKLESSLFVGGGCSESFNPQLYLLSPNQKTGEATFILPNGYGVTIAEGEWKPYNAHGLNGREGPTLGETLEAGTYYLVVQGNEEGGFYLVSLGGSEAFGGDEGGREAIPRFNACE